MIFRPSGFSVATRLSASRKVPSQADSGPVLMMTAMRSVFGVLAEATEIDDANIVSASASRRRSVFCFMVVLSM
jgi:hypothetical protein